MTRAFHLHEEENKKHATTPVTFFARPPALSVSLHRRRMNGSRTRRRDKSETEWLKAAPPFSLLLKARDQHSSAHQAGLSRAAPLLPRQIASGDAVDQMINQRQAFKHAFSLIRSLTHMHIYTQALSN